MTATNHALTGVLIATVAINPIAIIISGFFSHFLLDSLPHYSMKNAAPRSKRFIRMLAIEGLLVFTIMLAAYFLLPSPMNVMAQIGVLSALAPDFLHIPKWFFNFIPIKSLDRFHVSIQKYESARGIIFEVFWGLAVISLILILVMN